MRLLSCKQRIRVQAPHKTRPLRGGESAARVRSREKTSSLTTVAKTSLAGVHRVIGVPLALLLRGRVLVHLPTNRAGASQRLPACSLFNTAAAALLLRRVGGAGRENVRGLTTAAKTAGCEEQRVRTLILEVWVSVLPEESTSKTSSSTPPWGSGHAMSSRTWRAMPLPVSVAL
jgi:hypothetical protein